jgi:predicted N-acetyltransferase YhbS
MEIRQITAADRTQMMFPLQAYAFMPSPWSDEETASYGRRAAYYETALSLIAEEDGKPLASVAALPMRQNVRGLVYDMAGIASVATDPSARRRGLVRTLLTRALGQMREQGCAVSALYPFRPSFYAKFGFVGIPRQRKATFAPAGLSHLVGADLPGTVEMLPMRDGFEEYKAFTERLLAETHGFALFDEVRTSEFREGVKHWVVLARVDGEVVGAVTYRVEKYGGDLVASDLLSTGPLGRALLLQFFARHVDQVERVTVTIGTDEVPELWGTDMAVVTQGKVDFPREGGPMVRVLDLAALSGTPVGDGAVTVEVVGDEFIGGVHRLESDGGALRVTKGENPSAALTAAGLSGLVYGVLDPVEVVTRGLGEVGADAIGPLRALFPKKMPYIFADF